MFVGNILVLYSTKVSEDSHNTRNGELRRIEQHKMSLFMNSPQYDVTVLSKFC